MKTYQIPVSAMVGKKYQQSFGREARLNLANVKLMDKSTLEPVTTAVVDNYSGSNIAGTTSSIQSTSTVTNYTEDALALGGSGTGITGNVLVVYSITSDIGSADISITSLLSGSKWGGGLGQSASLTFSFSTAASVYNYPFSYKSTISEFRPEQKQAARNILGVFSNVANLSFTEVADTPTSAGDLRFANAESPTASAFLPNGGPAGGDMIFGGSGVNPLTDIYDYFAVMHEIGHSLGLTHTHNGTVAGTVYDQVKYTVMSYRQYQGAEIGYIDGYFPTTLMLDDVQALQFLYGINPNYKSGNDSYSWAAGAAVFETIVDSGGVDTIDASNQLQAVKLNLNSGQWSEIGTAQNRGDGTMVRDNLTIAYSAVIENALGTNLNDTLFGNSVNNNILGNGGNDALFGNEGNDTLDGWSGNDWLDGGAGNDLIKSGSGDDTAYAGEGQDVLFGEDGNDALFGDGGDDTLSGGVGNDWLNGGAGNDSIMGDVGDDQIIGGDGNDTLNGWSGNDWLQAEAGNDVLKAGSGDDTNYAGMGNDTISGEDGNDALFGELGSDLLMGGGGNDWLNGGDGSDIIVGDEGSDRLIGGLGADSYWFTRNQGVDVVDDTDSNLSNVDRINFSGNVSSDQLWFEKYGNNLNISIIGTSDMVVVLDWFSGVSHQVEEIATADGKVLLNTEVATLVSAMAAFSAPAAGQTTLPASYQTAINPILAANWS